MNITPDSFSDGGAYLSKKDALAHAYCLADGGADIIDVGGESTRPGSSPITEKEELERVIGVISELAPSLSIPISIDTSKPAVAEEAVKAGASIINDICGLRDDKMMDIAAAYGVPAVITHMHGSPKTFKTDMMGGDALAAIKGFLEERAAHAVSRGVRESNLILDPGVGFGKTPEQDMAIIENSGWFGGPHTVLIGPSRKRFLASYYPGIDGDEATAAACIKAADSGAGILRVHNVRKIISALENRS